MIRNNVQRFCCEDISLIENYDMAISDKTKTWHCHHRLGIELNKSRDELKEMDLYYNRPACELIFLTDVEHKKLHGLNQSKETLEKISTSLKARFDNDYYHDLFSELHKGENNPMYGHIWTDEQIEHCKQGAKNRDNSNIGKYKRTEEINQKMSEALKGKMSGENNPMYGKRGKDNPNYGLHWYNNGEISIKARECPEGFIKGRIYIKKNE